MPNITKSYVDGLKCRDAAYVKWDSKLAGFGVRVYARDPKGKCKRASFSAMRTLPASAA